MEGIQLRSVEYASAHRPGIYYPHKYWRLSTTTTEGPTIGNQEEWLFVGLPNPMVPICLDIGQACTFGFRIRKHLRHGISQSLENVSKTNAAPGGNITLKLRNSAEVKNKMESEKNIRI